MFIVSSSDVEYTFDMLDNKFFGGQLPGLLIKRNAKLIEYGNFWIWGDKTGIELRKEYDTFSVFVGTLAHELIHAFQYHELKSEPDHNLTFYRKAKEIQDELGILVA